MIVKPSPETPIATLAVAHLAQRAGFPPGVFNVLTTDLANTPSLSESLCKHPLVKKVSFTGSTRVGKLIAGHCATGLKKVTLELGGNCPFLVFDDADLEQAAREKGLEIRLFPSTTATATLGGFIAGGSSGVGAIRWGGLRNPANIRRLRLALGEPDPIRTVRSAGYALDGEGIA